MPSLLKALFKSTIYPYVFSFAPLNGEVTQKKWSVMPLLICPVSVKQHLFVGKSPVTMAISWYLCTKYFHILVWNKTSCEKDRANNDNSVCVQGIVSRSELLSFVFVMVPGEDIWGDLANLMNVVLPHTCPV